ncbi:MAG TPA: DnaA N-terminal domain-containing protein, partial [Rubricoccaceae bacterium]
MDRSRDDVWAECLGIIRDNISRQSFRTWFEPLRAVGLENEDGALKLTVQLPSRFYYEWLEEHYFALLRKTITKVLGPGGRLYYDIVIERDEPTAGGTRSGASMELPARQPSNVPPPEGAPVFEPPPPSESTPRAPDRYAPADVPSRSDAASRPNAPRPTAPRPPAGAGRSGAERSGATQHRSGMGRR